MFVAELLILATTFGTAPAAPPAGFTSLEVTAPPGIEVAFPAVQDPWPADWVLIRCENQGDTEVCEYGPPEDAPTLLETAG